VQEHVDLVARADHHLETAVAVEVGGARARVGDDPLAGASVRDPLRPSGGLVAVGREGVDKIVPGDQDLRRAVTVEVGECRSRLRLDLEAG
jgi:hypothetical protein